MALFKRSTPTPPDENRILSLGRMLLETARRHPDAKGLKDKLAEWAMHDQAFKVQLFRFVDTFPVLSDSDLIHRHLTEYLSEPPAPGMDLPQLPPGMGLGLKAGALISRQPFGGFGMSGIGSKAGGDQYLYQFVEPRCITENTMRSGFAPGLAD